MRHIISIFVLLSVSLIAFSVPAQRSSWIVRLTDGTQVLATFVGDEYHSWLLDEDGFVLERAEDGVSYVRTNRRAADEEAKATSRRAASARHIGSSATAPLPCMGSPRVPVLLVEFQDTVFTVADTPEGVREHYNRFCNGSSDGVRRQYAGSYGSIRDYFRDQSEGKFTPEFVIIGPVRLSEKASYYGQNDSNGNKDIMYNQFRRQAITAATEAYEGNWSDFDNKNKGQVDLIFFVFAGPGENTSYKDYLLWPKESTASETINGIKFATTGCTSEMRAVRNNVGEVVRVVPDGIGVFCHELSHALGLPDFYDTNYKGFGMDLWSLMDYGCYAGNSGCPGGYTSYELDFMGWRELTTITENGTYNLEPLSEGGKGVKVVNQTEPDEYYVIENRQRTKWDQSICKQDSGLLVIHVDYDKSAWNGNRVNTVANHQRMTIIAANNRYIGTTASNDFDEVQKTWAGNLYPFEDNDSLTRYSTPAATVYSASGYMNQDINHIRINSDKTVSFYFGNDYVVGIRDVSASSDEGPLYDLSGRRVDAGVPVQRGMYVSRGRKRLIR